ncbi:MAG: hypothetical protein WAM09_14535 [Anaerolineales bacterium]
MSHPLEQLKPAQQKSLFIPLLILTIFIMVTMNIIGLPLNTPVAPSGIVSFELAFSPTHAQQIILSWNAQSQLRAAFLQGLDFLFPLVYSVALGLGCILTSHVLAGRGKPFSMIGAALAWGLWIAALCDYIENIALVVLLFGRVVSPYPEIAGFCALIKFTLILAGIAYILYGLLMRVLPLKSTQTAT